MRRILAKWVVQTANGSDDLSRQSQLLKLAIWVDPTWSVPWYNLGLQTKYQARWEESVRYNQRAVELNPKDEAGWWNLGIAATALRDWPEARRAWRGFGVDLDTDTGEVSMPCSTACIRLNPNESGEVVWGERLDPARTLVLSVPLPESGRRFRDIILNDGAASGTRTWRDSEVPVFDELAVWQASTYSTFQVELRIPDTKAEKSLQDLCFDRQIGVEDLTTIRMICAQCSHGNPAPHNCNAVAPEHGLKRFGFGASRREDIEDLLNKWGRLIPEAEWQNLELALKAGS